MLPDYYAILGVTRSATQLEIKAAYRAMAKLHHPDRHGGDPEKERLFKEINEAYQVLSDTTTKMAYDKQWLYQQSQPQPAVATPPPPTGYYRQARPYHYQHAAPQEYVFSKWTLMYGKIFIALLVIVAVLFPSLLNYYFSNYFYQQGLEALAHQDYIQAEANFKDAIRELGGSSALAAIKLAEMKIADGHYFDALTYTSIGLDYAVKVAEEARLIFLEGRIQELSGQPQRAVHYYRKALRWFYSPDSVYRALAPLYAYQLKDYKQALAAYDSLLKWHPSEYELYLHRGFVRQKLDIHQPAVDDFNRFINQVGANGSVLFLKGVSQLSLDRLDSACQAFQGAADLGLDNAYTFLQLYCQDDTTDIVYPTNPF